MAAIAAPVTAAENSRVDAVKHDIELLEAARVASLADLANRLSSAEQRVRFTQLLDDLLRLALLAFHQDSPCPIGRQRLSYHMDHVFGVQAIRPRVQISIQNSLNLRPTDLSE